MQIPNLNLKIDETSALLKKFDFKLSAFSRYQNNNVPIAPFILPNYLMIIGYQGRLNIASENLENTISSGDVAILSFHHQYQITCLDIDTTFYYIDFGLNNPKNTASFEDLIQLKYKYIYYHLILERQLENLYYLEKTVTVDFPGTYLLVEGTLLRILIVIIKYFNEHNIPVVPNSHDTKTALLNECINYINLHIHQYIKITDMAAELKYSENYIYKIFKELMGLSCQEYILTIQLNNALNDLLTTDHNISDIAFNNGFNSLYHFSKAFKRKYGYSPSNLRKHK